MNTLPEEWLDKYYPVPASEVEIKGTELDCAKHCLRKWEGLRPCVLSQHGLVSNSVYVRTCDTRVTTINIDAYTCALCLLHDHNCSECVLERQFGSGCNPTSSAYGLFRETGNPEPMIKLLKIAVNFLEEQS